MHSIKKNDTKKVNQQRKQCEGFLCINFRNMNQYKEKWTALTNTTSLSPRPLAICLTISGGCKCSFVSAVTTVCCSAPHKVTRTQGYIAIGWTAQTGT